jgi:hypothetical protein
LERDAMTDKHTMRDVGKSLGLTWVEFNPKTGRHTFTRKRYKSITQISLQGVVLAQGGVVSDKWTPGASEVWEEYECYPDQIGNGDLAYFVEHGLSQTGPRPRDEVEEV